MTEALAQPLTGPARGVLGGGGGTYTSQNNLDARSIMRCVSWANIFFQNPYRPGHSSSR